MKLLKDFDSLNDAQLYPIPNDTTYNSNEMTVILLFNELFTYFETSTEPEQRAVFLRLSTASIFDFRSNQEDGLILQQLFATMIFNEQDYDIELKLTALRDYLVGASDRETFPYKDATEEEYQIAKLSAPQDSLKTNYEGMLDYHVRNQKSNVRVFINCGITLPVDTDFKIYIHGCSNLRDRNDPDNFKRNPIPTTVRVPAGESGIEVLLRQSTANWIRVTAVANKKIGSFELDIQGA